MGDLCSSCGAPVLGGCSGCDEHRQGSSDRLHARMGRQNGWWYVNYRRGGPWGRNHYGSLPTVLWCLLCVRLNKPLPRLMRPYGEHL